MRQWTNVSLNRNLIPFAIRDSGGRPVDVHDVPRGKKCECVCPSCKGRLIARQGKVNEWHFAHEIQRYDSICEYTFFVSLRDMVKYLLVDGINFRLPGLNFDDGHSVLELASPRILEGWEATPDYLANGILFDICIKIDSVPLVIFLSYPGRRLDFDPEKFDEFPIGVIEIELNGILSSPKEDYTYTEMIRSNLARDSRFKVWRYHPRQRRIEAAILKEAEERRLEDQRKRNQILGYSCIQCGNEWRGIATEHTCSNCKTHLFTREK